MRKVVERLSGAGTVYREDGDLLGNAQYDLRVYQEFKDVGTKDGPELLPGLKDIEGHVTGLDNFALTNEGAKLTLRLEDGRSLRFYVTDLDGRIGASGGLQEPS